MLDSERKRMLYRVPVGFQLVVYAESPTSAVQVAREEAETLGMKIQTQISVGTPIEILEPSQIPSAWKGRVPRTDAIDFLEQTSEQLLPKNDFGKQ